MLEHKKVGFSQSEIQLLVLSSVGIRGFLDGIIFQATLSPLSCGFRMMETGMTDVVNLNRFRKRAAKEMSAKEADANRARFGRSKSERAQEQQRSERAKALLDQHRLGDGEAS